MCSIQHYVIVCHWLAASQWFSPPNWLPQYITEILLKMALNTITLTPLYSFIPVFALIFFRLLARQPNLEICSIYSNKFFHYFHFSESSFTCPGLRASGLVQRLLYKTHSKLQLSELLIYNAVHTIWINFFFINYIGEKVRKSTQQKYTDIIIFTLYMYTWKLYW